MAACSIRDASPADVAAVAAIYNYYIAETTVSYEEELLSATDMQKRVDAVQAGGFPWLVAEQGGQVVGFCYGNRWNGRAAYRYTAEVSVYLDSQYTGQGLGECLYKHLFSVLASQGIKTVIGGVSLPNPASVALHEKMGMQKVAHFSKVGYKFGQWLDVGYWQGTPDR